MRIQHAKTRVAAALAVVCVAAAHAQSATPTPPQSCDALVLARWRDQHGDSAVLRLLEGEAGAAVRLAAVLASPFMDAPELSLVALSGLSAGRDPDLAPAASAAALRIVNELSRLDLGRRETLPEDLVAAQRAFSETLRKPLRADIALQNAQVASQLESLTGIYLDEKY